jgi:hypothetical protein
MPSATTLTFGSAFTSAGIAQTTLGALLGSQTYSAHLFTTEVNLPSFPAESVCENYADVCAAFIAKAKSTSPQLVPNCSATTTVGSKTVRSYPSDDQTIVSLDLTVGAADDLSTATETNDYVTLCPEGFVVPDEPDDDRIKWVEGTGCAVGCRQVTRILLMFDVPYILCEVYSCIDTCAGFVIFMGILSICHSL